MKTEMPFTADDFLPDKFQEYLKQEGIDADGLGLIRSPWGIPFIVGNPSFTLLAHTREDEYHQWAGTIVLASKERFMLALRGTPIGYEVRARQDWRFGEDLARVAQMAAEVQGGLRARPDIGGLTGRLSRFSRLYEEWRNHFGFLLGRGPGEHYRQQDIEMMRRKGQLEDKMDVLREDILRGLKELSEA